ncbi:MAG: hypothetical protein GX424_05065 [Clostridiales bacterium]|nr:hypothetical protein [Clostridiales bacterium]
MKTRVWGVLFTAVLLLSLAGCAAVPADAGKNDITGTWKDSCGLTEYRFEPDGKMKIEALNLGSFQGTYKTDGDTITIQYRVLTENVKDTYRFRLDGNSMYLDENRYTRKK